MTVDEGTQQCPLIIYFLDLITVPLSFVRLSTKNNDFTGKITKFPIQHTTSHPPVSSENHISCSRMYYLHFTSYSIYVTPQRYVNFC